MMTDSFDFNNLGQQLNGVDTANMGSPPSPTLSHQQHHHDSPAGGGHSHHHSGNVTVYPTTGPGAYTKPIQASDGSGSPALNPRSCVTCRRRKVRCDKQMPCSNCRRAQISCVFPAPGRAPRQPRPKDPNAPPKSSSQREVELIKRLKKLEGIVEELGSQIEEPTHRLPSSVAASPDTQVGSDALSRRPTSGSLDHVTGIHASPAGTDSPASHRNESGKIRQKSKENFGRMVSNEGRGTSRYVSSAFWSKLNDELDAIREETQRLTDEDDDSEMEGTPTDSPATAHASVADHHAFVLGYRSADVDLQKCHPLPSHATFLWSVYQENVEPLIKLVHVPTVDLVQRDARRNCGGLSPGNEALVFAIYFAAITSLEPDEVKTNFGASKDDLIVQYRFAVEQALSKANFLDTSDLAVLQAFTLFLIVVRRYDESRFCWALTGLLIRLAQGMGLHRDGTHLRLSPFETEMRRRLWWAILVLDLRSSEELGMDMAISERSYDTLKPNNINDLDICPQSTEPPAPREGRSDSAVAIVRCEICALSRRLLSAASAMSSLCPNAEKTSIAERERMLLDVYQRVEHRFLQHVLDETDALYWVAAMIARVIVAKMCLIIYHPMLFPGSEVELSDEIRQRIYVAAIELIELNHKLNTDARCKQYRWLFKTYTNWHAIAYTLIETCRRPWTALVERGWDAVNGYDIDPLELARKSDHAAVVLPLRQLFARARKHREAELSRLRANPDEARRLDAEERKHPAQARFSPMPGPENRMDVVREQWLSLVRLGGEDTGLASLAAPQHQAQQQQQQQQQQQPAPSSLSNGPTTTQPPSSNGSLATPTFDLSAADMDYVDGFMAQPHASMVEFWNLNDLTSNGTNGNGNNNNNNNNSSSSSSINGTPALTTRQSTLQSQLSNQDALQQEMLAAQMQPTSDSMPPYLWTDPFTIMNTKFQVPQEDEDMLGGDFNWKHWSQNLKDLEMDSTQTHQGW